MNLQDLLNALQEAGVENVKEVLSALAEEINAYLGEEKEEVKDEVVEEATEDDKMKKVFGI